MKLRTAIIFLVLVAILLMSCVDETKIKASYFKSKSIENSNLIRIIDSEFDVVCYWFGSSGVSSTLSCVRTEKE